MIYVELIKTSRKPFPGWAEKIKWIKENIPNPKWTVDEYNWIIGAHLYEEDYTAFKLKFGI
jgi:hypothetical protein